MYIKKSLSTQVLGKVLRKHQFEFSTKRKGTIYYVVELSGAEIAANKKSYEKNIENTNDDA